MTVLDMNLREYIEENYRRVTKKKLPILKTQKSPILIGITGSVGKSSTAYLVTSYLKFLGYRVSSSNSIVQSFPEEEDSIVEGIFTTKLQVAKFLYKAIQKSSDIIVIECNENSILNGVFDEIKFDYKILSTFKTGFNPHLTEEMYLNTKLKFFENNKENCKVILNAESDNINDFILKCEGITPFLFATGKIGENDFDVESLKTLTNNDINLFPILKVSGLDKSFCEYCLEGENDSFITTLSLNVGIDMSLLLLAFAAVFNDFNIEKVKYFLENVINIPGRCEDIQVYGRTILIDSGNSAFLEKVIDEINSPELKLAQMKYLEKYGELFETFEPKNIRAIFSHVVTTRLIIETLQTDPNFVAKNSALKATDKEKEYDTLMSLIFSYNLYCLVNKTNELSNVNKDHVLFNQIEHYILDFSNSEYFSDEYLQYIKENWLTTFRKMQKHDDDTYYINSYCRMKFVLKNFLILFPEVFNNVYNYFLTIGNDKLNEACDYLKEKLDSRMSQFDSASEILNKGKCIEKIKKIYITTQNANTESVESELNILKNSIKNQNKEIYPYRKDAIKAILEESEVGDLIIIAGRGSSSRYQNLEKSENFRDIDIVNEVIQIRNR